MLKFQIPAKLSTLTHSSSLSKQICYLTESDRMKDCGFYRFQILLALSFNFNTNKKKFLNKTKILILLLNVSLFR